MRILIAEDQTPIILALEKIIQSIYPTAKVDSSQTLNSALNQMVDSKYDLIISDLDFEEGKRFAVVKEAKSHKTPCIIYSLYYNKILTNKAKELKVAAYICKLGSLDDIEYAIKNYKKLNGYLCKATRIKQNSYTKSPLKKVYIRGREEELLQLVISGYTQKDISKMMGITHNSVRSYLRDIIKNNDSTLPQIIRNYLEWNHPK
jgi:DNA-binding NarL/FixJ family response regulator